MAIEAKYEGFDELAKLLEGYAKMADQPTVKAAQEAGASYFVKVMRAKSSPRGRSKHHMLDSIGYEYIEQSATTIVGWELFYGRMVESGHKTVTGYKKRKTKSKLKSYSLTASAAHKKENQNYVSAQRHMKPEFDSQVGTLQEKMIEVYEGVVN